jgi:hypothetical protein
VNPIASRLSEASVLMEGTPHHELVEMLRIGAEEIERLSKLLDGGIDSVWRGRRLYFKVMEMPRNTTLACVFNHILKQLGETRGQNADNYKRYYPEIAQEEGK